MHSNERRRITNRARRLNVELLDDRCLLAASGIRGVAVDLGVRMAEIAGSTVLTQGRLAYHSYTGYGVDGELHVWDFVLNGPVARAEQTVNNRIRYVMNPQFSGDGRFLAMMGVDRQLPKAWPNLDVFLYDFQADSVTNLSEAVISAGYLTRAQDWIDEDPSFDPTSMTVAFKRRNGGQSDLWSVRLDSAGSVPLSWTRLTNTPTVEESGPKFAPDGQSLVCWVGAGTSSWIGKLSATGGAVTVVVDHPNTQDYYPSYWDSTRIIYSSWDTPGSGDDDIRVRDLASGIDLFGAGAFHSSADDSDAFRISSALIGFSTINGSADGKWRLWYGDPIAGTAQVLPFHTANKHDLGGTYSDFQVNYVAPPPLLGDYNGNGSVDAADYVVWRHTLGSSVAVYSGADGNGSGSIDPPDYMVWRSHFANILPPGSAAAQTNKRDYGASSGRLLAALDHYGVSSPRAAIMFPRAQTISAANMSPQHDQHLDLLLRARPLRRTASPAPLGQSARTLAVDTAIGDWAPLACMIGRFCPHY